MAVCVCVCAGEWTVAETTMKSLYHSVPIFIHIDDVLWRRRVASRDSVQYSPSIYQCCQSCKHVYVGMSRYFTLLRWIRKTRSCGHLATASASCRQSFLVKWNIFHSKFIPQSLTPYVIENSSSDVSCQPNHTRYTSMHIVSTVTQDYWFISLLPRTFYQPVQ